MGRRTREKTDSILVDVGMHTESYLSVGWCRSCIREKCFSRCLMHPPNMTCLRLAGLQRVLQSKLVANAPLYQRRRPQR